MIIIPRFVRPELSWDADFLDENTFESAEDARIAAQWYADKIRKEMGRKLIKSKTVIVDINEY